MSTTTKSGVEGTTSYGTEVTRWNLKITTDMLDASSMSSAGWKEHVPGLVGVSGSFTSNLVLTTGAHAGISLTDALGIAYTCDVIVTNVKVHTPVDGVVEFTADFEGSLTGV